MCESPREFDGDYDVYVAIEVLFSNGVFLPVMVNFLEANVWTNKEHDFDKNRPVGSGVLQ